MAHFAEINENGVVTQVIVVSNAELDDNGSESEAKGVSFLESLYGHGRWVQASYNGRIRKNYPGVGYVFDTDRDAFIPPRPYASWVLDENSCQWTWPVPPPGDLSDWKWDENSASWVARSV